MHRGTGPYPPAPVRPFILARLLLHPRIAVTVKVRHWAAFMAIWSARPPCRRFIVDVMGTWCAFFSLFTIVASRSRFFVSLSVVHVHISPHPLSMNIVNLFRSRSASTVHPTFPIPHFSFLQSNASTIYLPYHFSYFESSESFLSCYLFLCTWCPQSYSRLRDLLSRFSLLKQSCNSLRTHTHIHIDNNIDTSLVLNETSRIWQSGIWSRISGDPARRKTSVGPRHSASVVHCCVSRTNGSGM